jgi:serine/threonine protein kinase
VYEPFDVEAPTQGNTNRTVYYYFVQEYIEGEDLQKKLKNRQQSNSTFSEVEVQDILKQVLEVLHCIHSSSPPIIHLDIKPSNIIQTVDGSCYLVDFGAVKQVLPVSDPSRQTTILGTPGYAPPEQFDGTVDFSSDLYALARTCICLLTGSPSSSPPWGVDLLTKVLKKMISLAPQMRYRSTTEVKYELKRRKISWNWIFGIVIGVFVALFTHVVTFRPEDTANTKNFPPHLSNSIHNVVNNIPRGDFYYGGSTTWEPLSQDLEGHINNVIEKFKVFRIENNWSSEKGVRELRKKDTKLSFALSSKPISSCKPEDGDCNIQLMQIIVAKTSKVLVVNQQLKLDNIKEDDLLNIQNAKIEYWDELKGYGLPHEKVNYYATDELYITPTMRNSNSIKIVKTKEEQFKGIANDKGGVTIAPINIVGQECSVRPVSIGDIKAYNNQKCEKTIRRKINPEYIRKSNTDFILKLSIVFKDDHNPASNSAGEAYATILMAQDIQDKIEELGYLPIRDKS